MPAHILVVDDEPDLEPLLRQRFRRSIRDGDWTFAFAHDGQEALEYLNSGAQVDVVLSDINMPIMDGLTLLSHLRSRPYLKVVMVSAYADMGNIREAMNRGAFDFVTKPMNLADLEATIGKTVQHVQSVRQLRDERDAAQDLARLKGEFIANVSHEIRTPMNAILGFTHLALQDPIEDPRSLYLRKIQGAAKHLLSIINDILDMSKMGVGKLVIEHSPFKLQDVLSGTIGLVEDQIVSKRLTLTFDIGPRVPRRLVGDARRIGQVLLNFLSNAVKFTPEGGITLRLSIDQEAPGQCLLRFVISDTGVGLQPEQMGRLFQAFEQADGSVTRKHGGTGLGLSIAKSLSELMGGEVGVESDLGRGSNFWFTVRLAVQPQDSFDFLPAGQHRQRLVDTTVTTRRSLSDPLPEPLPNFRGMKVLLVEDNRLNIDVAQGLLERCNAEVDVAENGAQAISMVASGHYDLVLMDIQMPVLDGLAATRQIRCDPARRQLPIIAMTASAMSDESQRCLEAGMNDLIVKPIEPAQMFATLQRWVQRPAGEPGTRPMATPTTTPTPTSTPPGSTPSAPTPPSTAAAAAAPSAARPAAAWDVRSLHIEGLNGLLGQQPLYTRMLKRFATTQAGAATELREAWLAGDLKSAGRVAHTVKGICGTVGALALAQEAEALELALHEGAAEVMVAGMIERFEAGLVPLCDALKAALP